jgi:hypothetical protein
MPRFTTRLRPWSGVVVIAANSRRGNGDQQISLESAPCARLLASASTYGLATVRSLARCPSHRGRRQAGALLGGCVKTGRAGPFDATTTSMMIGFVCSSIRVLEPACLYVTRPSACTIRRMYSIRTRLG